MKLLRTIILYGTLSVSLFLLWNNVLRSPCERIVEYSIGEFDERFEISKEDFIAQLQESEIPWEEAAGKNLFEYVPGADFKVNLIWSEEQERLYKGNDLQEKLDSKFDSIDTLQSRYGEAVKRYERAVDVYESSLAIYEKDVSYWNNRGGAPTAEYKKLQSDAKSLEKKAAEIKRLQSQVNRLAEENNANVETYNSSVEEFNELHSYGYEFDAGNTDGTEINIFSYDGNKELQTLIVHEYGHVLGIDHVEDPEAVMHYLLNDRNQNGVLAAADIAALGQSCRLK